MLLLITETENPNQTAATHDLLNNDIKPVEIPKSLSAGIGKSIFEFKISPLDGYCLKVSWSFTFPDPSGATLRGISRVRIVNKTKL